MRTVHMAVYQKMDHDITFEVEIALLLVKGEELKIFINPAEGMWYGSIHQNKPGQTLKTTNLTKPGQDYVNHINKVLSSLPKKRSQHIPVETNYSTPPSQSKPHNTPYRQSAPNLPQPYSNLDPRIQQFQEEIAKQKKKQIPILT
jgi:hypothetical protein